MKYKPLSPEEQGGLLGVFMLRQVFHVLMIVPQAVMFLSCPNGILPTSENIKGCCCCFEFQPSL